MEDLSYLANANGTFVEDLYTQYQEDASAVDPSWQRFFEGFDLGQINGNGKVPGNASSEMLEKEANVMKLVNAYRDRGHLVATTNPVRARRTLKADLDIEYHHLTEDDLDKEYEVGKQVRIGCSSLRQIISHLDKTYCGSIGAEFRYIPDSRVRMWLHEEMETTANSPTFGTDQKTHILTKLAQSVGFEKFLHKKYAGQKRFSLEGCEALVPALDAVFQEGAKLGAHEFVMGMAHRGRLNVLATLFGKRYDQVFCEFDGVLPANIHGDGDVKYHLGHSADIVTPEGNPLHLALMFNPSHLEAVNPVVLGSCRAKAKALYDNDVRQIVPVLIHGDAAIAGQGIVYECANFHKLRGYTTGGVIHIVLNNQVGFTANYRETRSTLYCTDIAKVTESPVFHVNADDPEAVVHAAQMAIKLRQTYNIDVYIDILGYRRYGHNEGDEPRFTQPMLYKSIGKHPTVLDIYKESLVAEGSISAESANKITRDFDAALQDVHERSRNVPPEDVIPSFLGRQWNRFRRATPEDFAESIQTGIRTQRLNRIAEALVTVPDKFNVYPKLLRLVEGRRAMYFDNGEVDWGLAESLAIGSLLLDDVPVRLSGQDSRRGTFSHRHAVLIDFADESEYIPLNHIQKNQQKFSVYNSHLSEYGVLGFEYGYSSAAPQSLVMWEAQFGDFANGAQIIYDQFISSGESKWQRMSGITCLLPHGNEGQGPEHSSARICRFLQSCADNNMIVAQPTTPANFFHLLRRQALCEFRKPLVVMTPKGLLRHQSVRSPIKELRDGKFREFLGDESVDPAGTTRVLVCSGKIYYELDQYRQANDIKNVAILRVEQLYPWAEQQAADLMAGYPKAEWIWMQEEAANMGAWAQMRDRFADVNIRLLSRREGSSPAIGSMRGFKESQTALIAAAFA
ncbi:MAG: 2-oxoglutarate dehydrogenase E1 component [Rhodothermales bacterium]|jgi:2-oxoglutarate dehydrogenase E1 component